MTKQPTQTEALEKLEEAIADLNDDSRLMHFGFEATPEETVKTPRGGGFAITEKVDVRISYIREAERD